MALKKDKKASGPYEWAENPLKLVRAQAYVANLEVTKQVIIDTETEREAAVKERYLALRGHIVGAKMERPRSARPTFGGQQVYADDEEDENE